MTATADQIARWVDGNLRGDAETVVDGPSSLENCRTGSVVYVEDLRRLDEALQSPAVLLIVPSSCPAQNKPTIAVANPRLAFARVLERMFPEDPIQPGIHPTALVDARARVHDSAEIGPLVVVEAAAEIGERCRVGARCIIGRAARIGKDCRLYPGVILYPRVILSERVIVHAGAVIGSDGFGYARDGEVYRKFPQVGGVLIEDDVEIGANSCVDRGALDTTVIGRGTKIDNLVQVAHNVRIGNNVVIASQTGISGSVVIEDGAVIAGQVGLADHVRVERNARIGAQAGVPTGKIIRKGQFVWGTPARPMAEFSESFANVGRIPKLREQIRRLQERLDELEKRGR